MPRDAPLGIIAMIKGEFDRDGFYENSISQNAIFKTAEGLP